MIIELNEEKASFCFIGEAPNYKYPFSFSKPKFDVNLDDLTSKEREGLLYNIRRGTLKTKDQEGFAKLSGMTQRAAVVQQSQPPVVLRPRVVDPDTEAKELRDLLSGNVNTVKKEAVSFRHAKLRRLFEMEKAGKTRKGLLSFLQELLDKHTQVVQQRVGTEKPVGLNPDRTVSFSTQVSEVVESDTEAITIKVD